MVKFGDNLKNIRIASGLTQKTFAEKMNTTQQRVSEWERGLVEPSLINVIKIIKVLDTSFEELAENIDIND